MVTVMLYFVLAIISICTSSKGNRGPSCMASCCVVMRDARNKMSVCSRTSARDIGLGSDGVPGKATVRILNRGGKTSGGG